MKRKSEMPQPGLFDRKLPSATLASGQIGQLATLLEVLLREIAAALGSMEVGDDQDHH